MNKFIILATLFAAAVSAELPAYSKPSYPAVGYPTRTANPTPTPAYSKANSKQPAYNKPTKEDHCHSADFSHKETSDGEVISGSYRVALADGRIQIVSYKADENGYVTDVKYEGEAKYDEYKPATTALAYLKPTSAAESAYPKPAYQTEDAYPKSTYLVTQAYPKSAYREEPAYPKPADSKPAYKAEPE